MGKFTNLTCSFIGQDPIPPGEGSKVLTRARYRVRKLMQDVDVQYFGVAGDKDGFDRLVTEYLVRLRRENSKIHIIQVMPYKGYRDGWTELEKWDAKHFDANASKNVYVCKEPRQDASERQYKHLIDGAKYCIVYCTDPTGRAAENALYAMSQGKIVYNASSFDLNSLRTRERQRGTSL